MVDLTDIGDDELWDSSIQRVVTIRDPVHDYVELPYAVAPVISHPFMQRLKSVSQTSMSLASFPSMTGHRFGHSIGAAHIAALGWRYAWKNTTPLVRRMFQQDVLSTFDSNGVKILGIHLDTADTQQEFFELVENSIAVAALIHDIGHPPFSHALEGFYASHLDTILADLPRPYRDEVIDRMSRKSPPHETAGILISERIREDLRSHEQIKWELVHTILSPADGLGSWSHSLHDLISGDIDVDRMDYLLRDAHYSGTEFGLYDLSRLVHSLELHLLRGRVDPYGNSDESQAHWAIGFGLRAISAVEAMLVARFQYYRWVVFNSRVVAMNKYLGICADYLLRLDSRGPSSMAHVPKLNYFASASRSTRDVSREMATVSDSTIVEWIRSGRRRYSHERIAVASVPLGDADEIAEYEIIRVRFLALADIVLFQGENWMPLWRTQWAYRQHCQSLLPRLLTGVRRAIEEYEHWADVQEQRNGIDTESVRFRRSLVRKLESAMPAHDSGDGPPKAKEAVNFMNTVTRILLREGAETPNAVLTREIEEAGFFGSFMNDREGMEYGFWVFTYDDFEPLKSDGFDRWTTSVFANNERRAVADIGDSSLIRLEEREAERAHFNCYFVHPNLDRALDLVESERVQTWFTRHFPRYVYDSLLHLLVP